jgi:hypothetical protein
MVLNNIYIYIYKSVKLNASKIKIKTKKIIKAKICSKKTMNIFLKKNNKKPFFYLTIKFDPYNFNYF